LKEKAKEIAREWRPGAVVVEDASSGISLLQELQLDTDLPLRPQKVASDKLVRAAAAEPTISAGRVMLPEGAPWAEEFLREVCAFPSASHDDFVDALVHAIVFLRTAGAVLTEADRQYMASANAALHARVSSLPGRTAYPLTYPSPKIEPTGEEIAAREDAGGGRGFGIVGGRGRLFSRRGTW
jgi:predicted phage terminase large subunit-like protein